MALSDTLVLDRLNEAERDVLVLLAQGHTAKSIAVLRESSVAAVNERLRSARRKTGIGSSREIARLMVAQENRHDFIDLAESAAPPPDLPRHDATRRTSPKRWRLPMTAAMLLAAAILGQQTATPPAPVERPMPAGAASVFAPRAQSPDLVSLRAEVTAGPVDPEWSAATEATLSDAYRRVTAGGLKTLDVTCNLSLCEVVGVSPSGLPGEEIYALTEAVQGPVVTQAVSTRSLENIVQSFSTDGGELENGAASVVFVAYWRRAD